MKKAKKEEIKKKSFILIKKYCSCVLIQHSCDGTQKKTNKYSTRIRRIGSNSTNIDEI